jgi:hypothetical protein
MFATYWTQDPEVKKAFREAIRRKVERERQTMNAQLDESLPQFVAWLAKPIANVNFSVARAKKNAQGSDGEDTIGNTLWFWLSKQYNVFDDVVLEPRPGDFIQLDHLVIAPQGIFIIETKTWSGSLVCSRKGCRRGEGKSWVRCDSNPIMQNERHVRLFREWLRQTIPELAGLVEHVYPIVSFKRLEWLKVDEDCGMPVLAGGLQVVNHMKHVSGEAITVDQAELLCRTLKYAKLASDPVSTTPISESVPTVPQPPAPVPVAAVTKGTSRTGRQFVRIAGTREQANKVAAEYASRGMHPGAVKQDQKDKGIWYFYLEQQEKAAN